MRCFVFIFALLLMGCKSRERMQVATANQEWKVPPPVGLVGDWVQLWPASRRGDTLTLRADSTARGLPPSDPGISWKDMTTITQWQVRFMSHDLSTERSDWWGGHRDGGEWSCWADVNEKCRSGPMLCLGDGNLDRCVQFKFGRDSLALDTGDRYVRVRRPQDTERST
jgi:hypothetical protein